MSFLHWSGVAFWLFVGVGLAYVLYRLIEDGIQCARFVARRIKVGGWREDFTLRSKAKAAVTLWFAYWAGLEWRPDYVTIMDGQRVYWPGCEPQPK